MSKLETLIEQTSFLIEKQKEATQDCSKNFAELLKVVEAKIEKSLNNQEDKATLERIHDLISGQAQKVTNEAQDDIDFLAEQLEALNHIKMLGDSEEAKSLLDLIVGDNDPIDDVKTFKQNVLEEFFISKQNFLTVINDIKDALTEGSVTDVELYLQSMQENQELEEESEEGDDNLEDLLFDEDDFEEDEEDSCCSKKPAQKSCHGCPSSCCNQPCKPASKK